MGKHSWLFKDLDDPPKRNVTIAVPYEVWVDMKKFPVNWSEVCRRCIENYLAVYKRHEEEFRKAEGTI